MRISDFFEAWPYLYHVTVLANLPAIRALRELFTAEHLLSEAGLRQMGESRREKDVTIQFAGFIIVIRSQQPLNPDCLELDSGMTLGDYVHDLNRRVYFWPGTESGPLEDGKRMISTQKEKGAGILRIPTASLFALNEHVPSFFSPHNTGAAWCKDGKKSHRGEGSFLSCDQFKEAPADVIEAGFEGTTKLPSDTVVAAALTGPWKSI